MREFTQPMIVSNLCPHCKRSHDVIVETADFEAWKGGKPIQDAFPYLAPSLREILMTGICGECFDKLFPPEEE